MSENISENRHPTKEECLEILKDHGTPEHVVAHCREVARVAVSIGSELNRHGYGLDMGLIEASALLHDVARTEKNHDEAGARLLEEKGFNEEAGIVRVHMHYPEFSSPENIDETDIMCLADRLVLEDRYVGIDKRMEYIINKRKADKKVEAIIRAKIEDAKDFISSIEHITGLNMEDMVTEEKR